MVIIACANNHLQNDSGHMADTRRNSNNTNLPLSLSAFHTFAVSTLLIYAASLFYSQIICKLHRIIEEANR